ncbi:hypothetical protein OPIT5_15805 [Opitutaceae bacterium TAV5]|nr:hypothetical protein OPIT5_15805 [Opitutaceae bacterium TAV5]
MVLQPKLSFVYLPTALLLLFSLLMPLSGVIASDEAPIFRISENLFDHNQPGTLGLPVAPGHKMTLYYATDRSWTCNLDLAMTAFKGRIHVMWANGRKDESGPGQRILWTSSADGLNWDEPQVLIDPGAVSSDQQKSLGAGGWAVTPEGALIGYATDRKACYAVSSKDGRTWSDPADIGLLPAHQGIYTEGPRRVNNKGYVLLGQAPAPGRELRFLHFGDLASPATWQLATLHNTEILGTNEWREPSLFVRPDGTLVSRIRASWESGKAKNADTMFAAESTDGGKNWRVGRTNFPDAIAKSSAGNLPDGTAYIVSNPGKPRDRRVLAISLSRDGRTFDRAFAIGINPPPVRFTGRYKGANLPGYQGPASVVSGDYLYVGATASKDDVVVFRIPLAALGK